MNVRPSVLCPVDYSPASTAALRFATALAEHFVTRLIVMAVRNVRPEEVEREAAALRRGDERALTAFIRATFGKRSNAEALCEYELAAGTPAAEIGRVARERSCELIVMGQPHPGVSARDGVFGTVEAILVGATIPVLLTPPYDPGLIVVDDLQRIVRRVVVAVEPTADQHRQRDVAIGLAEALGVELAVDYVPMHGDASRAERPPSGRWAAGTDLVVVCLSGSRDQMLHSWTTIRVSLTEPALVLVLPPAAWRCGEVPAVTREKAAALGGTGGRKLH